MRGERVCIFREDHRKACMTTEARLGGEQVCMANVNTEPGCAEGRSIGAVHVDRLRAARCWRRGGSVEDEKACRSVGMEGR